MLSDSVYGATGTTMSYVSTKPYIPSGTYDLIVKYTPTTGSERTLIISKVGTSTAPTLHLQADYSGYTSYSYYKGINGQTKSTSNANSVLDGATISGVGAKYGSGLSTTVKSQADSEGLLGSFTTTVKNSSGTPQTTLTSCTPGAYTISASATFDGVAATIDTTRTVYVTGLPYNKEKKSFGNFINISGLNWGSDNTWTTNRSEWSDTIYENKTDYLKFVNATLTYNRFYLPNDKNINVNVYYDIVAVGYTRIWTEKTGTTKLYVGVGTDSTPQVTATKTGDGEASKEGTITAVFTNESSNNYSIIIVSEGTVLTGACSKIYKIQALYRD